MTGHLTGVPGCASFVTPLVAEGGACGNDYECTTGWCKPPAPPATGDGKTPTSVAGMSCTSLSCGEQLTCDGLGTDDKADDVCVQRMDDGATCTDGIQCKSGNCTTSGGSGMTCAPATGAMCFYGSGCSAGGDGRPGPVTILLLVAFVGVTLLRTRRGEHRS